METTALSLAKSVLNGAVAKATSVITEEVALQLGVRRDVAFINDEFEMMQTFLLAADEERGEKKVVRTWVKQVRDLGYDVEDCLQDFSLHLEKPSWWRFPCTMWKRRSIANEIIDLRARVEDVSHRNLRYRLIEDPSSKPTTAADRYLSSTAAVFGIDGARRAAKLENEKVDLVDLITKDDEDLRVITVWGTSNDLGKMSTIRKAYEDPKITEKFRCRAWVKLVNPFDPDEFLRSLVRQFYGNSNLIGTPKQGRTMGVHISKSMAAECDMENEFDKHVNQNQYMIVIEDLSTISEWDWIKLYLPDTKKGSRILVSTQQIELASLCVGQPNQVSELKQFSSDQSLYIFFHKEGNDPTETSLDAQRDRNVAAHETITELISQDLKTREVISVWGTDITQRTALVRSIYENQELDGKFQRCAWITVQHPIDHAVFLKSLIRELDGENLEAEAEELVEELASLLKGQMYLIVLDNISTSIAWDSIVSYFPAEECRSRIIVTTADGSVAKHCSEKHENTHELEVQEGDIEADSNKNKEFKAIGLHSSFTESDLESNSILESAKDNGATLEEPELIGREEEKSRIIEMLLRPDGGNRYCVTSVWGMGGVGKTTLVESIYHCPKIIEEFPRRLWATLLQPFNPDVFKSGLASQLQAGSKIPNIIDIVKRGSTQSYSIVETGQLLGNITEKLLIVVDGISSEGEWDMVKTCLPENMASGSRIIVTTREASVAADCSVPRGNHINLQGLKYADAFKLFKTKISKLAEDFESDPEMMEQAERIIIKCGHLPLAIATIGGFLASRPASTMEWRKLNDHIGVELEINSSLERINKMVISSYNGLPFHLKACFLYLSIFPEGRNLRRRRLVRRWIAEGYSSKMLSLAAEEVGEKHFTDLLNRSMIQPSKATASNGEKVNLYQVNNLMHAISISKTTEEKLVCTLDDSTTNPNSRDKVRHLVVSRRCSRDKNNALVRMMDLSRIRSLTVFGEWRKHLVSSKMRLLRVLDLEDTTGLRDKDLEPIGKLRHLKFLSLRGSQGIFHLPRSFGKLLNLETLDIRGTLVTTLPGAIVKLQKLSYLRAGYIPSDEDDQSINVTEFIVTIVELLSQLCGSYRTKRSVDKEQMRVLNNFGPSIGFIRSVLLKGLDPHGVKVPKRIGKMKILHTLGVVNVARGKTIKELKTLTKLRKLGVTGINKKNGKDFCSAVEALSQLESLSVRSEGKHGLEGCLDDLSSPPKNLQSVKLYGHIAKLPTWINPEKLRNLSKLSLRSTCLEHDGALRDLEKLPKLAILCLWRDSFKECAVKEGALKEEGAPEEEGALKKQGALSLKFGPGTFPQLNKLEIADLDQLQWVVFENTAMAELEILQVDNCFDLDKGGFSGTDFLPKLKEVRVRGGYGDAFKKTLQEQVTKTTLIIMA